MKVACDTSVIVAAVVEGHPHHARASWWLRTRRKLERIASWHAYAEAWAHRPNQKSDRRDAFELCEGLRRGIYRAIPALLYRRVLS